MDENKIKSEEEKKTSEAGKEHQMKETEKAEKKEISKLKGEVKKLTGELEAKAKACDELNDTTSESVLKKNERACMLRHMKRH